MQLARRNLLVRVLADIDQQIAKAEDPSLEPVDSDQVQRAVPLLFQLRESRSKMESFMKCSGQ